MVFLSTDVISQPSGWGKRGNRAEDEDSQSGSSPAKYLASREVK